MRNTGDPLINNLALRYRILPRYCFGWSLSRVDPGLSTSGRSLLVTGTLYEVWPSTCPRWHERGREDTYQVDELGESELHPDGDLVGVILDGSDEAIVGGEEIIVESLGVWVGMARGRQHAHHHPRYDPP